MGFKIPMNTRGLLMNPKTLDALVRDLQQAKPESFCLYTEERIDLHLSPYLDDGQIVPMDRDGMPLGPHFKIKIDPEVA